MLLFMISIKTKDEEERSHTPGQMALEGTWTPALAVLGPEPSNGGA